ncbi:unnamed protein product [Urochloa humidicola]
MKAKLEDVAGLVAAPDASPAAAESWPCHEARRLVLSPVTPFLKESKAALSAGTQLPPAKLGPESTVKVSAVPTLMDHAYVTASTPPFEPVQTEDSFQYNCWLTYLNI